MQNPAPMTPQGLNFQSDPSMRSQFKGFMSGMAQRQVPAPQPMIPMMPQQMSSVDIFQPVQNFRGGGGVGRMDYQGAPMAGVTGNVAGSMTSDIGSSYVGPNTGTGRTISGVDYESQNFRDDPVNQILNPTARPAITQLYDKGIGALQSLFGIGGDMNQSKVDQMAIDDAGMVTDAPIDNSRDLLAQQIADARQRRNINSLIGMSEKVQGIDDELSAAQADLLAMQDTAMPGTNLMTDMAMSDDFTDFGPSEDAATRLAQEITAQGGQVDVNPVTGQVIAQYTNPPIRTMDDVVRQAQSTMDPSIVSVPTPVAMPQEIRQMRVDKALQDAISGSQTSPTPIQVDDVTGVSQVPPAPPAPAPAPVTAPKSILDRAAEKDAVPQRSPIEDLASRMTDVTFGTSEKPISSLEQLAIRSGEAPGYKNTPAGMANRLPSFGSAIAGALGRNASGAMYNDIMNKGYIPQYDARGQIVATINPKTGQLGRGSVEARIDRNNIRNFNMNEVRLPSQEQDDDPTNPFLRLLGFEQGGEVPTPFRAGGGVGRQDYQGGTMSGVTGDVAGSTTSDAASSRATEGLNSGTGVAFSGADLYDYDKQNMTQDNVQTLMATPMMRTQSVSGGPVGPLGPQSQDVVPATVSDGKFLQPTQAPAPVQQPMSVRERIQSVAEASTPTFGDLLGNLFDFSSSPEAPMSDIERIQGEIAIKNAMRGDDYYGQSLTPAQTQAYSQGGMDMVPAGATLQAGQSGGRRTSVPVSARYESYNPYAAGVEAGVEARLGEVRRTFN